MAPLSPFGPFREATRADCWKHSRASTGSTVEALDGGFKIVDANGQTLADVYGHADSRDAEIAKSLTLYEARRIASNIANLPDLLGKGH